MRESDSSIARAALARLVRGAIRAQQPNYQLHTVPHCASHSPPLRLQPNSTSAAHFSTHLLPTSHLHWASRHWASLHWTSLHWVSCTYDSRVEFIKAMRQRLKYTGPGAALKDAFARLAGNDGKIDCDELFEFVTGRKNLMRSQNKVTALVPCILMLPSPSLFSLSSLSPLLTLILYYHFLPLLSYHALLLPRSLATTLSCYHALLLPRSS